ncbi:MAG: tRNA modification radical SAM protein MnmL/YtqA [Planctomycetota bacterium]|jgi:radical SAM protein (TIGR01212 family)
MDELPYRNLASYLRERFGTRVFKIPVDAGFDCPNRDGTVGVGGCSFCENESFSPPARKRGRSVAEQVEQARRAKWRSDPGARFMVYFQAFTNTHAPPDRLVEIYGQALCEGVVALAVGTRPDSVPDTVLGILSSIATRLDVWLELGLQSSHDETLKKINRGHGAADFVDVVKRASGSGLKILAHVILGLPGEGTAEVKATARFLASLPIDGVKVHHLYVARNTALARAHERGEVALLTPQAHAELVADFLERIPDSVVVHRLVSDAAPPHLVAPRWDQSKAEVLGLIIDEFRRRGTRQGSRAP